MKIKEVIKNAKIESAMLGYEDHGILTFSLNLKYTESLGQHFGNCSLGGKFTDLCIRKILSVTDSKEWDKIKGKHIRVKLTDDTFNGSIIEIGHITNDIWFNIEKTLLESKGD